MKAIFIVADSFRRDHIGAYGNGWIHTPNLDRLAAESSLFERAYIGAFPTGPARRDLMLGSGDPGFAFNRWKQFEREEITLPERLAEKKVPSMLVTDTANMVTNGRNLYKGFTAWAVNRGQEGDPCWLDESVPIEWPVDPHLIRYTSERWHQVLINRAHRKVETDWFAPGTYNMAIQWLERNYHREDFFLWIDTFDPHEPWDPPQHYLDLYDPGYKGRVFDAPTYGLRKALGMTVRELRHLRARYAGEVTMVDACVGRLMETLDRLRIRDDVMIVFTSDHGEYFDYPGDGGLICKPAVLGADGMVMSGGQPPQKPIQYVPIRPGVARIPLIIHLPGQHKGRRIDGIVQPWDVTATVLDFFGLASLPNAQGVSLLPRMAGRKSGGRRLAIYGSFTRPHATDGRWLYATWFDEGLNTPPAMLFDMKADPAIRRNAISHHPEMAKRIHREIVSLLRKQGMDKGILDTLVAPA